MKTVTNNATSALFEKVEQLSHQSTTGWKCIYFKAPDEQERRLHSLSRFDINVVTHMVEKLKGYVFVCEQEEIFILYRGNYNSLIFRLSMYLWSLSTDRKAHSPNYQPFSLFDVSSQWESFYRFCEKRYMAALVGSEAASGLARSVSQLPAELRFNEHVAGYLK